ncbi:hypothetical protein [Thalassiella azotivora]
MLTGREGREPDEVPDGLTRRRTLGLGVAAALAGAGVLATGTAHAAPATTAPRTTEGTRPGEPECLADLMEG